MGGMSICLQRVVSLRRRAQADAATVVGCRLRRVPTADAQTRRVHRALCKGYRGRNLQCTVPLPCLCMIAMAVSFSFSGDVAIRYVLPVLLTTSCGHE